MASTPALTGVEQAVVRGLEHAPGARVEGALDENASWPVTRLAGWSMTLLLGATLCIPAIPRVDGGSWLILPAVVVITAATRAVFEAVESAARGRSPFAHAAIAITTSVVATSLLLAVSRLLAIRWSMSIGLVAGAATAGTLATARVLRVLEIRRWHGLRRIYFLGSRESFEDLARELAGRRDRELVGATLVAPDQRAPCRVSLLDDVLAARATVLVLDAEAKRAVGLGEGDEELFSGGVGVRELVSYYEYEFKKISLHQLASGSFACGTDSNVTSQAYVAVGPALEACLALLMLLLATPLIVFIALLIRLTNGGPAFYRQVRVGRGGTPFVLVKLRTMTEGGDNAATWASSQSHRVTAIGRYLRRYRLDELPQLWNVVRGDLALIGPRPEQVTIVEHLKRDLACYDRRHCIRPGMTGWAQVKLGYEGSVAGALSKLQHDLYYVKHRSLRLDVLILWLTLRAVLAGRG